jgi:outer membrane protein OmpA-like peptidoglycan-associated protein
MGKIDFPFSQKIIDGGSMRKTSFWLVGILCLGLNILGQQQGETINLLSLQEGTMPVIAAAHYGGWTAETLLDESPASGWACEKGKIADNIFVFEMINAAEIESLEFDSAAVDTVGAGAREIVVEVSPAAQDSGFETILQATLAAKADKQAFKAQKKVKGRWVRLTIKSNHGAAQWTELFGFRGYGLKPAVPGPLENISGTYDTKYSKFHIRQQGTALVGCYEFNEGLLDGAIEGRLMKLTWREGKDSGPVVMIFNPDGKSFRGYWWRTGQEKKQPGGTWDGSKASSQIGGCPHWSGSLGGELKKQLASEGRARVYGILFDLNSATIKAESKPVLEEVLGLLQGEPSWKLTIEGHTDSTGGYDYNLKLSLQRADAVKAYLLAAGIEAGRLQTRGFGSAKPVADNASEMGRAQNRRVELVR